MGVVVPLHGFSCMLCRFFTRDAADFYAHSCSDVMRGKHPSRRPQLRLVGQRSPA